MLKNRAAIAIAVLLAGFTVSVGIYAARTATERALVRSYTGMDAAFKRKDIDTYASYLTTDYTEIRLNGKPITRERAIANYRRIMSDWVKLDRQTLEVDKLDRKGDAAHVTIDRVVSGTLVDSNGAFGAKGASHSIISDTVNIDTWVNTGDGWKIRQHTVAIANPIVDGKPFGTRDVHDND